MSVYCIDRAARFGRPSGSHSRGWLRHDSRGLPAHRSCDSRKIAMANLVRLPSEDQKIIHAVGFHEILRFAQFVAGLGGFANDHSSIHPMICSVAIAINDSDPGSWSKR